MSSLLEMPAEYLMAIGGILVAYLLLGGLLLSLNATSRWMWLVKGGAIVVTAFFFVQSYNSTVGLTGWPSFEPPPPRFQLLWATWIEPNKFYGEAGSIYLWLDPLDETGAATKTPRSYRLPFSKSVSEQVAEAQALVKEGKAVGGTAQPIDRSQQAVAGPDGGGLHADRQQIMDRAAGLMPETFVTTPVALTFEEMQETRPARRRD